MGDNSTRTPKRNYLFSAAIGLLSCMVEGCETKATVGNSNRAYCSIDRLVTT